MSGCFDMASVCTVCGCVAGLSGSEQDRWKLRSSKIYTFCANRLLRPIFRVIKCLSEGGRDWGLVHITQDFLISDKHLSPVYIREIPQSLYYPNPVVFVPKPN